MDKISNQPFTEVSIPVKAALTLTRQRTPQREFTRLKTVLEHEKFKLPTKRQLEKKIAQIEKYNNYTFTEVCNDVSCVCHHVSQRRLCRATSQQ